MKITLDVDEGSVGKSVDDIMKSLSDDQKKELAKQVMIDWIRSPSDIERNLEAQKIVKRLMIKKDYGKAETEEEIRKSWDFRNEMEKFKSTKERMLEKVTSEVAAHYKSQVEELVKTDPKIQLMKDEVALIIKEAFPKMMHDAMLGWFISSMDKVQEVMASALAQMGSLSEAQKAMGSRLMEIDQRRM